MIEMRGRELRGQPVGHTPSVAGAAPRRNRVTPRGFAPWGVQFGKASHAPIANPVAEHLAW